MALVWRNVLPAFIAILFVTISLATQEEDIGNGNQYIDEILTNLRNEPSIVAKIDPLQIPEFSEDKIQGKNGVIRGLSSLYRHGDCSLMYDGGKITVIGEIAVRDVTVSMDYRAKALFFWVKGEVKATVEKLAVRLAVSSTNGNTKLESFKVADLGKYKIQKITGMSKVLNWLLKIIANSIAKKSRGKIIQALEEGAGTAIATELSKINFPIKM